MFIRGEMGLECVVEWAGGCGGFVHLVMLAWLQSHADTLFWAGTIGGGACVRCQRT